MAQVFTAERIATLSTPVLLDNLCDFVQQAARMRPDSSYRTRATAIAHLIKAELSKRAA